MKKNTQRKTKVAQNCNSSAPFRFDIFQGIHITLGYVMKNVHSKLIAMQCLLICESDFFISKILNVERNRTFAGLDVHKFK